MARTPVNGPAAACVRLEPSARAPGRGRELPVPPSLWACCVRLSFVVSVLSSGDIERTAPAQHGRPAYCVSKHTPGKGRGHDE
jgi:hypothetical protein